MIYAKSERGRREGGSLAHLSGDTDRLGADERGFSPAVGQCKTVPGQPAALLILAICPILGNQGNFTVFLTKHSAAAHLVLLIRRRASCGGAPLASLALLTHVCSPAHLEWPPSLLILLTRALTAWRQQHCSSLLSQIYQWRQRTDEREEEDGRTDHGVSHADGEGRTDGVIHLMKAAAATVSLSAAAAAAMKPSRSHAPKKTAPTGPEFMLALFN